VTQSAPMKGWSYRKLDELGYVGRGKSRHRPRNDPSLYGGDYPFIQTADVKSAEFYIKNYSQTYNEKGLAQSKLWKPGTLCITIAANIAETAILGMPACFPDSIVGFIADPEKADVRFVKYYINTIKFKMQNISRGTTQDNLSIDKLLTFDILAPPLPTQRKIAAILSAYDDLIENNTRRIKILEEMAQALYREWFVHFRFPGHEKVRMVDSPLGEIPEGWEVKRVKEIVKRLKAGTKYTEANVGTVGKIPVIDQSHNGFLGFHDNAPDYLASPENPILIFGDHTCKMQLMTEPFSIGPNVVPFSSIDTIPSTYLYFSVQNLVETNDYKRHWTELMNKTVIISFGDITRAFDQFAREAFNFINNINQKLCYTRDILLPRLVRGDLEANQNHIRAVQSE